MASANPAVFMISSSVKFAGSEIVSKLGRTSTFLALIHELNPTEVPFVHQLCGFLLVCLTDWSGLLNLMPPSCVIFVCPLVSTRWHDSVN